MKVAIEPIPTCTDAYVYDPDVSISTIMPTRVVSHLARSDTPNITLVVLRVASSDTPNSCHAMMLSRIRPHHPAASIHCMHYLLFPIKYNGLTHTGFFLASSRPHVYIQQSGRKLNSMNAKNTKQNHRFMRMRTRT